MLALTMGEPAGIGGEITLAAWQALRAAGPAFMLLDDPDRVRRLAAAVGLEVEVETVADAAEARAVFPRALPVRPLGRTVEAAPGVPDPANAQAVIGAIAEAVRLVEAGEVDGIVTNPINKAVLMAGGFRHPGHTEFLAELAGVERTVMMLAGPGIRVVPVTIHIPLAAVPGALTEGAIVETARIVDRDLRERFAIAEPRITIAGLNPHAGEDGQIGREEIDVLAPAIARLAAEGIHLDGPRSADTLFHAAAREKYDVALCMYHDQALIPIKTLAFDEGVNVTLGLPFVRTSPDHGTAFAIAGRGLARPDSLVAAIRLAAELASNRSAPR